MWLDDGLLGPCTHSAAREGHSCLWGGVLGRGMRDPATPRTHEGCVGPLWVPYEGTKGQEGLRDVLHGEETAGVGLDQGPVTPEVTSSRRARSQGSDP